MSRVWTCRPRSASERETLCERSVMQRCAKNSRLQARTYSRVLRPVLLYPQTQRQYIVRPINTNMSNAKSKRAQYAQRQARLASGTCKECDQPRSQTLSGTLSVFCENHRQQFARQTAKTRVTTANVRYDVEDEIHYSECSWFKEYVKSIKRLMKQLKRPICTRDVHEALGYEHRAFTILAIKSLDDIEEIGAAPTRYQFRQEPRRIPVPDVPFGKSKPWMPWQNKPQPDNASVYGPEYATSY